MSGFQKSVNTYSSPAALGQIASGNPMAWYVAGPNAVVSGANGLSVGRFAWATEITAGDTPQRADSNALLVAAGVARTPSGFVVNEQQGNWTAILQESGLAILPWQNVELLTRGDVWAQSTLAGATRGQKAFANMLDGSVAFGAAGATVSGTAVTASFATNVMTVTVGSNIKVGSAITSAATALPANTYVTAQLTGTTGGAGTYSLSTTPGTIASQANTTSDYIETRFQALSAALINEFVKIGFGD